MSVKELGERLGTSIKDKESMKSELIKPGTLNSRFIFGSYKVQIRLTRVLVESQSIGTAYILGNADHGVLGTDTLGSGTLGAYATVQDLILNQQLTEAGLIEIAKWLNSEASTGITHFSLGTGSTAFTADDTALGSETARATISSVDTSTDGQLDVVCVVSSAQTSFHGVAFREVGLFNDSVAGDMFERVIINSLTMDNDNNYRITFTILFEDITPGRGIVVTDGLNAIRNWTSGTSTTAPTHMAWGTGTTNPAAADSTLEGEQQRNAFITQTRDSKTVTYEGLLAAGESTGQDITKSGVFNAAAAGTLFFEQKFAKISKTALFQVLEYDRLQLT